MRRSLGDVAEASSFPHRLRRGEGDEEKTTTKKSSPREVLLILSVVPRFSGYRCFPLSLSSSLLLLPLSRRSQADTTR
ncbi:hypothetical protein BHE74_00023424 [Ensete ventricosum]|nr:hypothetical protein BHE74_00023424 [Ensete ventricosum]